MTFNEMGFLSKEMTCISFKNYKMHKDIFEICYDLNRFARKVTSEFGINNKNSQQVIGASLFAKISNGFQACVLMYQLGLETEAKIILRTILEATFVFKAITKNEDEVRKFVNTDKKNREKLLNKILEKDEKNIYETLKKSLSKEMLNELKLTNKEEGISDVKVYE